MITLFHTADWHLGTTLYGQRRYHEQASFCRWFVSKVATEKPDVVLIAGDIFDTTTPSHQAQSLYYDTIADIRRTGCRHIVITGGNHDAPTLLNAIHPLVKHQGIHIVGAATDPIADEVCLLSDDNGTPMLIVCAVPYLRDRDVRLSEAGESPEAKHQSLISGIHQHYTAVLTAAKHRRDTLATPVPIIGMGHLFVSGGTAGEGVRDLYVGTLSHVDASVFSPEFAYVALGHLHVPQQVSGSTMIRYSGSPIPMGFGEARHQKSITKVTLTPTPQIELHPIPVFQPLKTCAGNLDHLIETLTQWLQEIPENLAYTDAAAVWCDITYTGETLIPNLRELLENEIGQHPMHILRLRYQRPLSPALNKQAVQLTDLTHDDVFGYCLDRHHVPVEQRTRLWKAYREITPLGPNHV